MANKTFNTRVKNKRDTAANWEAVATTFQPLDGELIIVDTAAGKTRFKVGRYDTAKGRLLYYNEIPFTDEYLYNDLNESQGKIYDKLKGIDDKSIIEMTLESVFDNTKFVNYRIGLWQFGKTGFYKLNIPKRGTTATQLMLYAQKTKEDGTTPEDPFSQDNLLRISPLNGDKQVESVFVQVDYTDTDTLTVYKVQFLNVITFPGTININTYNKTTQKWDFTSVTESSAKWANNATQVSNALTLTKGDTTTKFDGSTAQTVSIPTKTSELTNDSFVSYAEQTLTEDQQNQAKTNLGIDVLTGNTTTVTPTQVKEAILAGRPIAITYVDNTYGNLTFTSFGYSLENNVVVANLVATANGQYILADLTGMSNTNSWTLQTTELGTSTDIANNYVKYSESQILTDPQKTTARTNIDAISSSEVSSNYLSLDDTQELTEIQKDVLRSKLNYLKEVRVAGNWKGITAEERNEFNNSSLTIIQGPEHDETDNIPSDLNYPILLVPHRVAGTRLNYYALTANGDSYTCSLSYPSFSFSVRKLEMNQQTMRADPTEDMQIATKKYVDNSSVQSDWNQNDTTAKDYIKNRICYEETVPDTYEELQLTTSNWKSLTGYVKGSDLSKMLSIPLDFIVNGVKHYNVSPEWYFESKTEIAYFFNESKTVYVSVKENDIDINGVSLGWPSSSSNNISFLKIIKHENLVKQIDSKYIPIDSTPMEGSTNAASSDALAKLASNLDGFINALPNFVVAVTLDQSKIFTDDQKQVARNNIGAVSSSDLVQSDWNQNDTTAKDYIKNRICYTKDATEIIVLNSTLSFTDISQQDKTVFSYQNTSSSIKFNEGTVYNVNFDSISYSCIAFTNTNIPNCVILGNLGVVSELSSATNEPFVMVTDSKGSQGLQILTNLTGTSHSVKITEIHTEIIKLDKKYIPDDIFTSIENIDNKVEDFINNTQFLTKTDSVGTGSFSFNRETGSTVGENSATFGLNNIASGNNAFAEGAINKATGWNSHAEGNATTASGNAAHAEGLGTKATGATSHAEGLDTIASGNYSHTEGENTTAENEWSHAEGKDTNTKGLASHAEGIKTIAQGNYSHAEGRDTIALGENQHVEGMLNIGDETSLHIVGNGTYSTMTKPDTRSNAYTLDRLGNAWFAGNVYVGSTSGTNKDDGSKKLATEEYVNNKTTTITVDDTLSNTSTNPVQNKVVKAAIDDLQASIDSKPSAADAVYTATAASTDGVAYTATVSGIDSLTVGASFIMIPNKASTSKAPTLNVNGLGAKPIRRRLSSLTTSLQQGYSTNWIALNKPFTVVYDGTAWVIEGLTKTDGADVYGAVAQATADAKGNNIADTYATIAMLQSLLPKVTTITLTSNWVGDASPYYQDIALSCVTETSIVDLQPTPEQLNSWQDDGIAFTTLSGNGTVRVYVAGGKPSSAISVQVRVQEVTVI